MSDHNEGTIEQIALELSRVLIPLRDELASDHAIAFFLELGVRLTPAQASTPGLTSALNAAIGKTTQLLQKSIELITSLEGGSVPDVLEKSLQILGVIKDLLGSFSGIATAVGGLGIAGFNVGQFPSRLLDHLIFKYFDIVPGLNELLEFSGILERFDVNADSVDPNKPPHVISTFHFDKIGNWLSSPSNELKALYGFGSATFDGKNLFARLGDLIARFGMPVIYDKAVVPPKLDLVLAEVTVTSDVNPKGLLILIKNKISSSSQKLAQDDWESELRFDPTLPIGSKIIVQSNGSLLAEPPPASPNILQGDALVKWTGRRKDSLRAFVILGQPGGSRFEVAEFNIEAGIKLGWNSVQKTASGVFNVEAHARQCKVIIKAAAADGFLAKILPASDLEADFELGIGINGERGVYFTGSAALEVRLPTHIAIGPIELQALILSLRTEAGKFPVTIGVDVKASLGPLVAIVQDMGLLANFSFPPGGGNLGPLDLGLQFKPPKGVGLSLDVGGFKGGGFLMLDSEKGEYAGALELDFMGLFSVKAIGIINTRMPDGSKGFSLLIIITAEFTPIQLSFGFTLNGIGGIFGLNRMIVVDALAEGIRTNAIKSILFPENVIANITRIISDIKQFFPPRNDHFVIGPMAKLGWGTPSIITVELGLLLDLPDPMFAIVGVLKAVLPHEAFAILRLQVNFIGVVDLDRGYIFFRADLFDSRLLIYSITGSMAFLVSWGEAQTFALSVGGFHPDFRDIPTIPALPNGFRNMARIGISLLSDDNPRLKVESYFAVTSNTVQFGAKAELYASAAGFNVYGHLGYDVLFQFDPFRFIATLDGGIALREGTDVIAGINISARLMGPTPWDARGDASLKILFFEISVGFHVTWGDPPPAIPPETEDLLQLLLREYADTRNWRAELPPNNHLHVSLKQIEPPAGVEMLVIHPAGILTFSQRSLPLEDYLIQKFGSRKPLADNKFKLTNANANGSAIPADYQSTREQFAPGNFSELNDSDKLSRRSFEQLPSGFKLTGTSDLKTTLPVVRDVVYELSYLRQKVLESGGAVNLVLKIYDRVVKGSAVRQSVLSVQQTRTSLNAPPKVALPAEGFAVASSVDLKSHVTDANGPVLFATQAEAYQRQHELLAANPALVGTLQVVSHFELNAN